MGVLDFAAAFLLLSSLAQALTLPGSGQHNGIRDIAVDIDSEVKVVLSTPATLEQVAQELAIDVSCLRAANPSLSFLSRGQHCTVPYACCGTSCNGKFCSDRPRCHNHSTSTLAVKTGTDTTCYSTLTTSVSFNLTSSSTTTWTGSGFSATSSTAGTSSSPSSSIPQFNSSTTGILTAPISSTSTTDLSTTLQGSSSSSSHTAGIVATTNSLGQTVISDSSFAITLPTGISSAIVVTLPDNSTTTIQPSSVSSESTSAFVPTTSSPSQTISENSSPINLPTSISFNSTISPSNSSVVTSQPPTLSATISGLITTTNSLGQTVTLESSSTGSLSTDVPSTGTPSLPASSSDTFLPTSVPSSSNSGSSTTTVSSDQTTTSSTAFVVTTTNSLGETLTSSIGQVSASSSFVATPTTLTTSSGSGIISDSTSSPSLLPSTSDPASTTTTSDGLIIISQSGQGFTISSALSTPVTITNGNGAVITFTPSFSSSTSNAPVLTTTNSDGLTIVSQSGDVLTIPTGLTQATTITRSDGVVTTFSPGPVTSPPSSSTSSTSTTPLGLFPITTSVQEPKADDDGTIIPCNLWFFSLCIDWLDTDILGWKFNLPPGIHPPGPPPPITFPPGLSISISVSGTLPSWPTLTVGPDLLPTYEPEPDNCETESAELCLTSTSFGVSSAGATVTTTASSVLSTCATVYGCDVSDSSSSTTTTSTTSGYPYSCTVGCPGCNARRELPTATAVPSLPKPRTNKPNNLTSYFLHSNLAIRDIPNRNDWDVVAELYDAVKQETGSVNVVHDNAGQVGLSSSRFRYFDASETNIYVTGLAGCTSILVVSQLGAYISHLWEPSFTEPGGPPNFQADVIDYLNNGRTGGEADTEPLGALVQGGVFGDTATTKIFIMTPATYSLDLVASTSGMSASLTNGDNQPLFDGATPEVPTDRLTPIRTTLAQLMPGVPISQFTYRRQTLNNLLETGAYGKAMILYSNYQKEDPDTFENLDPAADSASCGLRQKAIWQCWIQGKLMGSELWDALPGQIAPNQKRQANSACTLSATPTTSPTSDSTPTSTPVSTPSAVPTSETTAAGTSETTAATTSDSTTAPSSTSTPRPTSSASASSSSTPTSTSSAPVTTTVQLPGGPTPFPHENIVCRGSDELPGHASIDQTWQRGSANAFCLDNDKTDLGPGSGPATKHDPDERGVDYYYSVAWKDNCVVEGVETQNVNSPIDSTDYCWSLMLNIYLECDNGGIGGYWDIGCLRYTFTGGM